MSTHNPPALCELCNQRPKSGPHDFCSKTCASQAAMLCDYCHKRPKFGGFDYCGKTCSNAANAGMAGGSGAAGYGSWISQAIKGITGTGGSPSTYTQPVGPPPASFSSGPPSQWQTPQMKTPQGQRGWTPNTNSQYAVAANYVPPAGNRGHGRPPQQRPSRSRPQSAGFQQYAGPPSTSVVAPAPAEIEYGTALDEYPEEPVSPAHPTVALCIMCQSAPQREIDHFCGPACLMRASSK